MSAQKETVIALLGQPNSGKSTLFNALTGLKQHVGNWPGKTVEKKEGHFEHDGQKYQVVDLPGSYSLSANSDEEIITRDYIAGGRADVVCILADSSQLERSLYMLADYVGINVPTFLLLNMSDVAEEQGQKIAIDALEEKLAIPTVLFSAPDAKNYAAFYAALARAVSEKSHLDASALDKKYSEIAAYGKIKELLPENLMPGFSPVWLAAKAVEGDGPVCAKIRSALSAAGFEEKRQAFEGAMASVSGSDANQRGVLLTGARKFAWIDELLRDTVTKPTKEHTLGKSDRLFTHRIWGKPAVIITVLLGLIASFIPAMPFMALGMGLGALNAPVRELLVGAGCPLLLTSLISDVFIRSLGFIVQMLGFVLGVTLVFGLLEEIGIMARISYVFDNTMSKLGLQGKSVMPFLVSFGCTMGGAAGSRVIDNWGQKVLTIALAWAVPCGATWAVVPMLATVWFGAGAPLIIVAILAIMILHMWLTSKIFGRLLVKPADRRLLHCGRSHFSLHRLSHRPTNLVKKWKKFWHF